MQSSDAIAIHSRSTKKGRCPKESQVSDIETQTELTEAEKQILREEVVAAKDAVEDGYWTLATKLEKVYELSLFVEWGYEDWPTYIEGELDLNIRSVQYMISIASHFGNMDPEIQEWVKEIGWSKAKELVKRVTTDNWKEWRSKIAGKTVRQITDMLKADSDAAKASKTETEDVGERPHRMAFALFAEQAATVKQAVEQCKADANTDKDGNAITLICQDFLAAGSQTLASRLETLEKTFGVKLIAVKHEADGVSFPYGESTLDELTASE